MPNTNGHGSKPERVALYLRVSSLEQRDEGTIETQRQYLERFAAGRELEVAATYADDGIPGTIPFHERAEGRRLLEDARGGRFLSLRTSKRARRPEFASPTGSTSLVSEERSCVRCPETPTSF